MHTHQNPKLGTIFTKIRQSNVDFSCALALVLLAFAFNYGRLRTFLLAPWRVSDYVSQSWQVRNYHEAQARNTLHSLYALYALLVAASN